MYMSLYIVTDLIKALLGNSSVNTFQYTCQATIKETVFSMWSVKRLYHTSPLPGRGGFEYFYRSPASRRRRRKGNSVSGGIIGPPCSWGYKYGA
jgi:hypothetical protein